MDQSVVIKGFKNGLTLVLDPTVDYETIKERVAAKFKDSAKFLGNSQMALKFGGDYPLNDEQKRELISIITSVCSLNIVCILEQDEATDQLMYKAIEAVANASAKEAPQNPKAFDPSFNGRFFKGSLRSGMEEIFEGNALILGDVNPGASVVAKGSIIVLGSLRGTAFAGTEGNENAFVLALDMAPVQIRIAETIARSPDHPVRSDQKEPQIAFLEDGAIYIEPVTKKVLSERTF